MLWSISALLDMNALLNTNPQRLLFLCFHRLILIISPLVRFKILSLLSFILFSFLLIMTLSILMTPLLGPRLASRRIPCLIVTSIYYLKCGKNIYLFFIYYCIVKINCFYNIGHKWFAIVKTLLLFKLLDMLRV